MTVPPAWAMAAKPVYRSVWDLDQPIFFAKAKNGSQWPGIKPCKTLITNAAMSCSVIITKITMKKEKPRRSEAFQLFAIL